MEAEQNLKVQGDVSITDGGLTVTCTIGDDPALVATWESKRVRVLSFSSEPLLVIRREDLQEPVVVWHDSEGISRAVIKKQYREVGKVFNDSSRNGRSGWTRFHTCLQMPSGVPICVEWERTFLGKLDQITFSRNGHILYQYDRKDKGSQQVDYDFELLEVSQEIVHKDEAPYKIEASIEVDGDSPVAYTFKHTEARTALFSVDTTWTTTIGTAVEVTAGVASHLSMSHKVTTTMAEAVAKKTGRVWGHEIRTEKSWGVDKPPPQGHKQIVTPAWYRATTRGECKIKFGPKGRPTWSAIEKWIPYSYDSEPILQWDSKTILKEGPDLQ